ncbi:hypothetical protein PHJA_001521500 [Phtheirospermum japonicum]|uniref:Uncharacterized protein n=1 Tax=Phtheirospermum japonicum TaxID=374723 RepID=A0A830CHD9_9LAMI|nr:hypothetical protein PHJA_001521500 [Phtheirospermum japonicum]
MKFLSELASCWGGAVVTPAADVAGGRRLTAEQGRYGRTTSKRVAKVKPSRDWKPKLNAISEDRPMSAANSGGVNRRTVGDDGKKRPGKVKPKSTAPIHEEDYWKSAHTMALPAFVPTPFLF